MAAVGPGEIIPPIPGRPGTGPSPEGVNSLPDFGSLSETRTGATRTYEPIEGFIPVSDAELRDPAPGDWLNARGNLGSWGYSPLSQINTENVDRLELAWVWGMEDGTRSQPAPLVHDGVMFLPNWGNTIWTPHPLLHKYRDTTWENGYNESFNGKLRDELLNGEIFYSLAQAAVLVEQWRREYNTVRPHSACGGFPPAPEAIKPSPWFLRMPVLHGPPQVLGLT